MRPEARPIKFTNGHTHFYGKKKVDIYLHYKHILTNIVYIGYIAQLHNINRPILLVL